MSRKKNEKKDGWKKPDNQRFSPWIPDISNDSPGGFQPQRQADPRCTATILAVELKASQRKGTLSDFLEKIDAIYWRFATGGSIGLKGREGQVSDGATIE